MTAFADARSHAHDVRSWMTQALLELDPSASTPIDAAAAALAQARLAWQDVAFWLEQAGQPCPPPPGVLADGFMRRRDAAIPAQPVDKLVREKREAVAVDLAALDRLIDWLAARERVRA